MIDFLYIYVLLGPGLAFAVLSLPGGKRDGRHRRLRIRAQPPNVILITLDTTRADRMGFLGSQARADAEPRRSGPPVRGFHPCLFASSADHGVARHDPHRNLSAVSSGERFWRAAGGRICPTLQTFFAATDIIRRHLSVLWFLIQKRGRLPALIADSIPTMPGSTGGDPEKTATRPSNAAAAKSSATRWPG